MSWRAVFAASVALLIAVSGCNHAQLVEVHPNVGGIVAIPANTNSWPSRHRRDAEELITQRCPKGYEIDYEGWKVTGQSILTNTNVNRSGNPTLAALHLSSMHENTQQTTTAVDKKEWHIWFRPKGAPSASTLPVTLQPSAVTPAISHQTMR